MIIVFELRWRSHRWLGSVRLEIKKEIDYTNPCIIIIRKHFVWSSTGFMAERTDTCVLVVVGE